MIFQYYIVDPDGEVFGTNDKVLALKLAETCVVIHPSTNFELGISGNSYLIEEYPLE